MARARIEVIEVLRKTAVNLRQRDDYQWGHMGSCNCGFLAQEVTQLDKKEIHRRAMQRSGDWNEQLNDYCQGSGIPMDDLISELTSFGFGIDDLMNLEKLSDTHILTRLPADKRYLDKNNKEDVILYLDTWANLLEEQLISKVDLNNLVENTEKQVSTVTMIA